MASCLGACERRRRDQEEVWRNLERRNDRDRIRERLREVGIDIEKRGKEIKSKKRKVVERDRKERKRECKKDRERKGGDRS